MSRRGREQSQQTLTCDKVGRCQDNVFKEKFAMIVGMEEFELNKSMDVKRFIKISQDIVAFLLQNKEVGDAFRKMIGIACPELQIFIKDDKKLCEEYISTMIVHRISGFPFPKENQDSFISNMLSEIKLSDSDFIKWVEKIKNDSAGDISIHFGIKNPIFPN